MPDTAFTQLLKERMSTLGLTDAKVSEALATAGVIKSPQTVGSWRRGEYQPDDDIRGAVAAAIGSDVVTVATACAGHVVRAVPFRDPTAGGW